MPISETITGNGRSTVAGSTADEVLLVVEPSSVGGNETGYIQFQVREALGEWVTQEYIDGSGAKVVRTPDTSVEYSFLGKNLSGNVKVIMRP